MVSKKILAQVVASAAVKNQYDKQLVRVEQEQKQTRMIDDAVDQVVKNLSKASVGSLVVYGDPQSGKTEMMICLTARLIDGGHKITVHLMNDSIDLLRQNLERFELAGLAPAPRGSSEIVNSPLVQGQKTIVFCKKNAKDLSKLIAVLKKHRPIVVVDDEADYATPNAKININQKTKINELVTQLLGTDGVYIGVTATPARLNLNNTFDNKTETWVRFKSHDAYTGQDTFFPQSGKVQYRLSLLTGVGNVARRS